MPRAEQNVQAEGAERLDGMSGHELPAAVRHEHRGQRIRACHALRRVKRFATAQASQAKKAVGLCAAEPTGEAANNPRGAFMMSDLTRTKMMTGSARGAVNS